MTNNQRLIQANRLYMLIAELRNHEHCRQIRPVIGELIWGVLVHALSAADPSHENQPPDRFGNSHQAPAGADPFRQAIRRTPNLGLSEARMESCLAWGQRKLHNHYYNGNLSDEELDTAIMVSAVYAMRLHYCAVEQTMPSAK